MAKRKPNPTLQNQLTDMAVAVPSVMSARLWRMAAAGMQPSQRDQREFQRMGAEKMTAFYESWSAMWMEAAFLPWKMTQSWQHAVNQDAVEGILAAGLKPIHRTAMANHRRLSRGKR